MPDIGLPVRGICVRGRNAAWRERVLLLLPTSVLYFPFEVLLACMTLLGGLPLAVGLAVSPALSRLPGAGQSLVGSMFALGGLTVAAGMVRGSYTRTVPRGLRVIGCTFTVYSLGVISTASSVRTAILSSLVLWLIAALSAFRAFYLRATGEMFGRIVHNSEN